MSAITDRLGIGDEIRELKLGRTLTSREPNLAFHTIRYDFKPASVDREKTAQMDVESNNKVTVTAPNTESSGSAETVFKGSRKPHQKECVLIIDHKTGEITLEKLNQNITVKRTRQQNPKSNASKGQKQTSGGAGGGGGSQTPIYTKKLVPHMSGSQQKPNSPLNTTNRQNSPNNKQILSPNKANGSTLSQIQRNSPSMSQPISPSMPTLSSLSSMSTKPSVSVSNTAFAHNKRDINEALGLSDSSSDSSDHESSSSSSDSSSDSSIDDETHSKEPQKANPPLKPNSNHTNSSFNKSKANPKSDEMSFSSDSDSDDEQFVSKTSSSGAAAANGTNGTSTVLPSMPKFSQLSEDLRLSESGSDSED